MERLAARLCNAIALLRWGLLLIVFIRYVSYVLELYQETASAGHWIVNVVLAPFKKIF